jgi:hypothetical protein
MAKLMRESRLRERRQDKQARKDARKQLPADHAELDDAARLSPLPEGAQTAVAAVATSAGSE